MTAKELYQLGNLKTEIENDAQRLAELRAERLNVSPSLSGSGGESHEPKLEVLTAEIIDLERMIIEKRIRCIRLQKQLEQYIESIPDSYLRTLFTLHFVQHKSYRQVARIVKGASPDSIRMMVSRYIKSCS